MDRLDGCLQGLLRVSPAPDLPILLPARPPWRSAPRAPSPSWTGFFGLWGRPTTRAASPVWCATAAWTAFLSLWMPRARSTASRTSTGQPAPQLLYQDVWAGLSHLPHDSFPLQYQPLLFGNPGCASFSLSLRSQTLPPFGLSHLLPCPAFFGIYC